MNPHTRLGSMVGALAVLALVAPTGTALAAPPDGGMDTTGEDYSDLVVLLRDTDGTPALKKYDVPEVEEDTGLPVIDPDTGLQVTTPTYCVQPVSFDPLPGVPATPDPLVDGGSVYLVPLQGEWIGLPQEELPVTELEVCDPQPAYGMFVNEVELERLNMARTADRVMDQKTGDVEEKLLAADVIDLDPAGRIRVDGKPIDAAPEHAAIYQSIMRLGILPGWNETAGEWTDVGPAPQGEGYNSQFDRWELAAAAVGTAASKGVPITIDTVEYYNQVIGFPDLDADKEPVPSPWGLSFIKSADPDTGDSLEPTRYYLDFSTFTYNRSETYPGSVTWLDIRELEWNVTRIPNAVPFTNPDLGDTTLYGVRAFQQMADDTRAVILFLHDNEVNLPGFYMDPVGIDTRAAQLKAVTDPAVDLGALPAEVFQSEAFGVTASVWNPHAVAAGEEGDVLGGTDIAAARFRITVDAPEALTTEMLSARSLGDPAWDVPFAVDENGDLVGYWGPEAGFPLPTGTYTATDFTVTINETVTPTPTGDYVITLELFDVSAPATTLATDVDTIQVNANEARLLWGGEIDALATQGNYLQMPLRVYSPDDGTETLSLTVTGPEGVDVPALKVGDVQVYGAVYDELGLPSGMATMPFTLVESGDLAGTWETPVDAGEYFSVLWYIRFAEGGPVGTYALTPALEGGNALTSVLVMVSAPEEHGSGGGSGGEPDTKPPVVHLAVDEAVDATLDASAAFLLTTDVAEDGVRYSCRLAKDSVVGAWVDCTDGARGRIAYENLKPGDYVFTGRAIDAAGNISQLVSKSWTVEEPYVPPPPPVDTTAPVVQLTPDGTPGKDAAFKLGVETPESGVKYYCRLSVDNVQGTWEECTTDDGGEVSFTDLEPATYVLAAKAVDTADNTSDVVTYSWTVPRVYDTVPPTVVLTVDGDLGSSASFILTTDPAEEGAVFECRLEKGGETALWNDCTSGSIGTADYTDLEPGAYVFYGRATDQAGNVSEPVTEAWNVPGLVPETDISKGPNGWVLAEMARFTLGSDLEGVTYQYRLNKGDWKACDAECDVDGLVQGTNRIRFRAVLGDEVDPTPALRKVYMPDQATALRRTDRWQVRTDAQHMFGEYVVTKKKGETLRNRYRNISRIALVASTGEGHGKVRVYVGGVRVRTINLGSYDAMTNRLINVKSFGTPREGVVRVVVASKGKPVSIDAVGVMP